MIIKNMRYDSLIIDIGDILAKRRKQAYYAVNTILVNTYWQIGKLIIEYEQKGSRRAEYGAELLKCLSEYLTVYGKGFSKSNIYLMRQFYLKYPKFQTVSGKLSWSHYSELLSIGDDLTGQFYEKQSLNDGWSVRELKRHFVGEIK